MKIMAKKWGAGLILFLIVNLAFAQEVDVKVVNELVQKEIDRILNSEEFDAAIEKGIERYILKQRQAQQATQGKQQLERVKDMRPVSGDRDHILGNVDAPVTLVEYSDFECPFCKRFHPTVAELLENNPDKVRWVYRHFPLDFHNPGAQKQAEGSECAAELGGNEAFWEFTDLVYERTKSNGNGFPLDQLQPLAKEIGIDGKAFSECMQSDRMHARVQQDIDNGIAIGVSGTPMAVLMNRKGEAQVIAGAQPLSELQRIVDDLTRTGASQ